MLAEQISGPGDIGRHLQIISCSDKKKPFEVFINYILIKSGIKSGFL
jgi:hypothetical protein